MRRFLALLLLILVLAPGTWLREPVPPPSDAQILRLLPQPLPPREELAPHLGAFVLAGVWELVSPHSRFGGYSALVALGGGELLAIGDRGDLLRFSAPGGTRGQPVHIGPIRSAREAQRYGYDAEAATFEPATKRVWIAWEGGNRISRHELDFGRSRTVRPSEMRDWGRNSGPEAMVRLADGRFIVLREGFSGWLEDERHQALLYAGDPVGAESPQEFTFAGPAGFNPTDMAQLPDGRVLILLRKLLWPAPARFAGRLVLADPAEIRPGGIWRGRVVARLSSTLPVDNFEGMAIEAADGGNVTVWLISDDNNAVSQRTLLWKLVVDPALLPGARRPERARGSPTRPSAKAE